MTVRDHLGRSLAVSGALAVLGVGALTMTERALAVAPASPALNAPAPLTGTNAASLPIADAGAARTSPITIAGGTGVVRDVDVTTNIAHGNSGDLDITLRSPSGKTVTLVSTRLGAPPEGSTERPPVSGPAGTAVNSYNGTVWDDQAATPATQAVYTGGVVSTLQPEGALGAFVGETPNGTWTLSVRDRLTGEAGTLNGWSLTIHTIGAPDTTLTTASSSEAPKAIGPDVSTVSTSVVVSGAKAYLWDVNAVTKVTHNVPDDMTLSLTHAPADGGAPLTVLLSKRRTGDFNFFNGLTFDDSSTAPAPVPVSQAEYQASTPSTVTPEGAMAAFVGRNPNGTWTLTVADEAPGDDGTLNGFDLQIRSLDREVAPPAGQPPVTPPPAPPVAPAAPAGPPVTPQALKVGVKRFALAKNARKRTLTLNVGWINGSGRVTYTATVSAKIGKRIVRRTVKGAGPAGAKNVRKTVKLPKAWKGKRVTVRLVVKNGATTVVKSKTIRRF